MYIGFIIYGDIENVSGGFLYDRKIISYLEDQGDEVEVIGLPWRTYRQRFVDNFSPTVHRQLREQYDVLIQDGLCHPSLLVPNWHLDVPRPIVSIIHSPMTAQTHSSRWNWLFREVERRYLQTVDGLIYNSQATAETIRGLVDLPDIVVPPGRGHRSPDITVDEITTRARESPFRIISIGNLTPRKGMHTLLEGLMQLPKREWHLTVIGSVTADRRYVRRLRRMINRLDLDDSVTLTGRLSDAELVEQLHRHHLLAVPSTYEAFGIVYLEGMGFGLPAVATTAGGADKIVADTENGILVPPNDSQILADRINPLLSDRDTLLDMSFAARDTYEAHHSWTEAGKQIRTFIKRLNRDADDCVSGECR